MTHKPICFSIGFRRMKGAALIVSQQKAHPKGLLSEDSKGIIGPNDLILYIWEVEEIWEFKQSEYIVDVFMAMFI